MKSKILRVRRRSVSVLLSLLIAMSLFTIVPFTASATAYTYMGEGGTGNYNTNNITMTCLEDGFCYAEVTSAEAFYITDGTNYWTKDSIYNRLGDTGESMWQDGGSNNIYCGINVKHYIMLDTA